MLIHYLFSASSHYIGIVGK